MSQSGFSGPINYYRNAMSSDLPQGHTQTKIKAPTLVVWVSNANSEAGLNHVTLSIFENQASER